MLSLRLPSLLNVPGEKFMNYENQLKRKCPFCAKEILADAKKCNHCGAWLTEQRESYEPQQSTIQQFSNAQPVWHLVILSIATFGLYEVYWFYRNWKQFKLHKNLDISPGWRTVGLLVPIYGLVLAYEQLRDIKDFTRAAGINKTYSPGWTLFTWLMLGALGLLPNPLSLLSPLSVLPLTTVQNVLNSYWEKEHPVLIEKTELSRGQIALLIIGVIWWALVLVGTFIPE